jgi:hypothetical protein
VRLRRFLPLLAALCLTLPAGAFAQAAPKDTATSPTITCGYADNPLDATSHHDVLGGAVADTSYRWTKRSLVFSGRVVAFRGHPFRMTAVLVVLSCPADNPLGVLMRNELEQDAATTFLWNRAAADGLSRYGGPLKVTDRIPRRRALELARGIAQVRAVYGVCPLSGPPCSPILGSSLKIKEPSAK